MRILIFSFLLLQPGMRLWAQEMSYLFVEKDAMSTPQSTLHDAATLLDIHSGYKEAWVAKYISTEITVMDNGKTISASGTDGNISAAQKSLLQNAAVGSKVIVRVKYMPENTLKHNIEQEMDYTYAVVPSISATFQGGEAARNTYVENHIIAKLDPEQKALLKIAKLSFTVAADGNIANVAMLDRSSNESLDAFLMQQIRDMPKWKPAQKSDGAYVEQTMKFFISNTSGNCLMY